MEKKSTLIKKPVPIVKLEEAYSPEGLKRLGFFVKSLREKRGLSQRHVAGLAGMSNGTLWRIEAGAGSSDKGRNILPKAKLIQLAHALDVDWELLKAIASSDKSHSAELVLQKASKILNENQESAMSTEEFRQLLQNEIDVKAGGNLAKYAQLVKLKTEEIEDLVSGTESPTMEQIQALAKQITRPDTGLRRDIEWLAQLAGVWGSQSKAPPATEELGGQQHLLIDDTTEGGILRF